jgi:uncharacterized protein (TIGR03437 family)
MLLSFERSNPPFAVAALFAPVRGVTMAPVFRTCLALAFLVAGSAMGAAPSYSAASIVNAANGAPGPFAPNSILTIYGTGLARSAQGITSADIQGGFLPPELNSTQVIIGDASGGTGAQLFYVSDGQINFVLPGTVGPDPVVIRVVREGQYGPAITLPLAVAAPALFLSPNAAGYIIASRPDYTVITPDTPAHAGEIVVLWATGLGKTARNPQPGELPNFTSQLADLSAFQVTIAGVPVDPARIQYAGLTPLSAALYQINLVLPNTLPSDPEIRVTVSGQTNPAGAKLAVR